MQEKSYHHIMDLYQSSSKGTAEVDLRDIQKGLERALIQNVYAPNILSKRSSIKKKRKKAIKQIAKDTKSALKGINNTMDQSIRGEWSSAIKRAVEEKSKKYDEI